MTTILSWFQGSLSSRECLGQGKEKRPPSRGVLTPKKNKHHRIPRGPQGHLRFPVKRQRYCKRPSCLPVPTLGLCSRLQLQDMCIAMLHFRLGKDEKLRAPPRFWGGTIHEEEEEQGLGMMPCEVLPVRRCGSCPGSHLAPHTAQTVTRGHLTKGASYLAFRRFEVLLDMTADLPAIKAWFCKIQAIYDSRQTVIAD